MKTIMVYTYLILTRGYQPEYSLENLEFHFKKGVRNFYGIKLDDGGFIVEDSKNPKGLSQFLSIYFGYTKKNKLNKITTIAVVE